MRWARETEREGETGVPTFPSWSCPVHFYANLKDGVGRFMWSLSNEHSWGWRWEWGFHSFRHPDARASHAEPLSPVPPKMGSFMFPPEKAGTEMKGEKKISAQCFLSQGSCVCCVLCVGVCVCVCEGERKQICGGVYVLQAVCLWEKLFSIIPPLLIPLLSQHSRAE